jgi:hypothetical protein
MVATLLGFGAFLPFASRADDPGARVARVSYVSGEVSYQRGDVEGWNDLRVNTPLVTGDSFYAPDGGRAEVDLGGGIVARVDGGTQIDLVNNTREITQLGINSGTLDLSARSFPRGYTLEIDTPTAAATYLEPGRYRVDVTDRMTTYAVIQGSMSLAINGQQLDVREGESLELENTDPPTYGYGTLSGGTPFQSWVNDRDSRIGRSPSARYVNANVVGYEDLDDHGSWRDNRDYGRVWVPSGMSQDWAPYQSGRWIWQDPYGWTWVSTESWGWAPYHYGRWVYLGNSWGWVPPPPSGYRGPRAVMSIQATYAPALVAFVGGRNWGLSLSIGGPAIGWVPLAPAESYYYPWQAAPRVTNNYTNITVINAVTVVNYNTFTTNVVRPIRIDRAQIAQAPVMGFTAVGVVPSRGSLVVSTSVNAGATAPRPRPERTMVTRLVPPPKPEPFAQKVAQIERTGRPVAIPVATAGPVGKPFVPGVQTPAGVTAVSALAPGGKKELKSRQGAEVRAPKTIQRDIAPPPAAPQATPAPLPPTSQGRPPQDRPNDNRNPNAAPPPAAPQAAPVPAPAPVDRRGKPPQDQPNKNSNKNPIVTSPPAPVAQPAAPTPAAPQAAPVPSPSPAPVDRRGKPPQDQPNKNSNKNPIVTSPPAPVATPVAPPTSTPDAKPVAAPPPVDRHGKPPQDQPNKKSDKNPIVTSPPAPAAKPGAPAPVTPGAGPAPGTAPVDPPKPAPKKSKNAKGKKAPEPPPPAPPPPPSPEDGQ